MGSKERIHLLSLARTKKHSYSDYLDKEIFLRLLLLLLLLGEPRGYLFGELRHRFRLNLLIALKSKKTKYYNVSKDCNSNRLIKVVGHCCTHLGGFAVRELALHLAE